jgi:hypothetical protein
METVSRAAPSHFGKVTSGFGKGIHLFGVFKP